MNQGLDYWESEPHVYLHWLLAVVHFIDFNFRRCPYLRMILAALNVSSSSSPSLKQGKGGDRDIGRGVVSRCNLTHTHTNE